MLDFLSGYKTRFAALALAAVGILEGLLGIDVPGVTLDQNWVVLLLGALGLYGIRDALSKRNK